jgi:hypothetical protein
MAHSGRFAKPELISALSANIQNERESSNMVAHPPRNVSTWRIDSSLVIIFGPPPKDPHKDDDENEEAEEHDNEEDEEPAVIREPDEC